MLVYVLLFFLYCKRGQASFETNENCKRNCISWDTIFYIDDYDRYSGGERLFLKHLILMKQR